MKFASIPAAAAAAITLASCSMEPYILTPEEEYTRQFIKEFGLIDPQQDWNMAMHTAVNIDLGHDTSDVKIYARVDGTYYLCATLENATGAVQVPVDVPDGTREMAVRIDGRLQYGPITDTFGPGHSYGRTLSRGKIDDTTIAKYTQVEASTSFNASNGKTYTVTSKYGPDPNDTNLYERFNAMQMGPVIHNDAWSDYFSIWTNQHVANTDNSIGLLPEGINNTKRDGIVQDFTLNAGDNGKFVITPMFLNTSHNHELGVYLVDDNGDPILDESGKIKRFPIIINDKANGVIDIFNRNKSAVSDMPDNLKEENGHWGGANWKPSYGSDGDLLIRSRSYLVDLGDYRGKVGMYIRFKEGDDINLFSQTKRNTKTNVEANFDIIENLSYAAAYHHPISKHTLFSFEDWVTTPYNTNDADNDLNDLIFRLVDFEEISNDDGDKITEEGPDDDDTVTETPISWIVAAEDLGSTDDFDFNDIVLRITCITVSDGKTPSTKRVEIQALAAGGTLPAYLHYCTPEGTDYLLKPGEGAEGVRPTSEVDQYTAAREYEWHRWFGLTPGQFQTSHMINTRGGASATVSGICILGGSASDPANIVQALQNFSIDKYSQSAAGKGVEGFYVTINSHLPAQDLMQGIDGNNNPDAGRAINGGAKGAAPQMYLIPDIGHVDKSGWHWPVERQHIISVYPTFKDWVNNATSATNWHKTTSDERRVMRITPDGRKGANR